MTLTLFGGKLSDLCLRFRTKFSYIKMLFLLFFICKVAEGIGVGNNIVDCSQCFAQQSEWTAWQCSVQCQHDEGSVTTYAEYISVIFSELGGDRSLCLLLD